MNRESTARVVFGFTGLVVVAGLVVQASVTAGIKGSQFTTVPALLFNMFCFFTVQSNVLVAVTCLLLARRLERVGTVFRVLRLSGLLGITLTFVIFHVALAHLQELQGSAAIADFLLHTASPILCVLGWLVFGPRRRIDRSVVAWSFAFPVLWSVFTLTRGALITWYPYPFIDVTGLGYGQVAINCVIIAFVFVALASGAYVLDQFLDRTREPDAARPGRKVRRSPASL